jgi:hypothetical protein
MAEAMYAMDILAAKLGGGERLEDWEKETGFCGPIEDDRPTDAQITFYKVWLATKPDAAEAFRNLVSSFVFLLAREAFGRCEALDELVCREGVFS